MVYRRASGASLVVFRKGPAFIDLDWRCGEKVWIDGRLKDDFTIFVAEVVVDPLPFCGRINPKANGERNFPTFVDFVD